MPIYLLLHLFTVSFPLIRSFEPRIQYAKKWKYLFLGMIPTAIFFLVWDVFFTRAGVWGFNEKYLMGWYILNLPIEEWLFFFNMPFASIFIYECVLYFIKWDFPPAVSRRIAIVLGVILLIVAFIFNDRAYTFWNFLFTGSFLLIHGLVIKAPYLGRFFQGYLLHLIPFLLVNGVLTGSFLAEPVVWYNDAENLEIRIGTIPIEDTMYSLLLLLMNITFFEHFKQKAALKKHIAKKTVS